MNGNGNSMLGEETSLSGRITAQDLTILGSFEGDLTVTGRLQLGPRARVKAKIKADTVEVEGGFEGEIRARNLTFAPSAQARGLFLADKLGIHEGALVEGSFNLGTESPARTAPRAEPASPEKPAPAVPAPSSPNAAQSPAA